MTNYSENIKKLAETLKSKLTDEEFFLLLDVSADYTTDAALYRELEALKPRPRMKL